MPKFEYCHWNSNTTHQKRNDIQLVNITAHCIWESKITHNIYPCSAIFWSKKTSCTSSWCQWEGTWGNTTTKNDNSLLQPNAFTSCTLTDTERRYSQTEEECLAICNASSKFHHWLYGHPNIEVHSDHKPLEIIVKKPLNQATARLQRMLLRLQKYQFKLVYQEGTSLYIADTLSRAPLDNHLQTIIPLKFFDWDRNRISRTSLWTQKWHWNENHPSNKEWQYISMALYHNSTRMARENSTSRSWSETILEFRD